MISDKKKKKNLSAETGPPLGEVIHIPKIQL